MDYKKTLNLPDTPFPCLLYTSHGCTVHFVTPVLDHGPIIAQGCVPVLAGDTPEMLAERVLEVEHQAFPTAVRWLAEGRVTLTNDHRVDVQGDPDRLFTWSAAA